MRPASWGAPISWEQADPFAVSCSSGGVPWFVKAELWRWGRDWSYYVPNLKTTACGFFRFNPGLLPVLWPAIVLKTQGAFWWCQAVAVQSRGVCASGVWRLNVLYYFFLAIVTEESRPGLNCAANLHNSLSFLPPRGRSILQLLPIPQTGNLPFWYGFEQHWIHRAVFSTAEWVQEVQVTSGTWEPPAADLSPLAVLVCLERQRERER